MEKRELNDLLSVNAAHFVPLRVDEGGAVRVGKSRISLDMVVEQYENGMSPEDIVRGYDTWCWPMLMPRSPTIYGIGTKCGPTESGERKKRKLCV